MSRKEVNVESITLIQNESWLRQKIEVEGYSSSRLAKELGIYRASVERYRIKFGIEQKLTPNELTKKNYQNKTDEQKESILKKRKQTNLQLYGEENTFQSHKDKITETMLDKYGVEKALQCPKLKYKQEQTMLDRYGVKYAAQEHLSQDILDLLENKNWIVSQHHTQKKTLKQIASELIVDPTTVNRACIRTNTEIKYYYESAQQREVSDWIQSMNVVVETNKRNMINGELDIYLPDYHLAIEYCGVFWHSDAHERMTPTYHLNKLRQCQQQGIRLITLYEDEWLFSKDIVKQKLLSILKLNTESIYARKCTLVNILDKKTKQTFFNQHHIQGDGLGSITIGLEYKNEIVSMMTFIQKQGNVYELNRYASGIRVVGGFQKLLKYFQTNYDWKKIVSFADLRWSEGNMYDISGFVLDKVLSPDYRYVIDNHTYHKFGFRRKALANGKIPEFDPTLSEVQNMRNAGIYRIFNCGLLRFVLENNK